MPVAPEFTVGDRVRLKPGQRRTGLLAGDTGTIILVLPPFTTEESPRYRVRMNRTTAGMYATLDASELERMP
jgi:hypothetical protein